VRPESTFKRVWSWTVRVTNCRWQTVPHDWRGHRESSVAKFRPRTWNRVVGASRRAQPIACWIIVAVEVYRIGKVVWALMCVDYVCQALVSDRWWSTFSSVPTTTWSLPGHCSTSSPRSSTLLVCRGRLASTIGTHSVSHFTVLKSFIPLPHNI